MTDRPIPFIGPNDGSAPDRALRLRVPYQTAGLRLCKMVNEELHLYEMMMFRGGAAAIDTTLRRAELSGPVGPLGETGDYWADLLNADGDWFETVALSRGAWNILKNRWMRCRRDVL